MEQILFHYPHELDAALVAIEKCGTSVLLFQDVSNVDRGIARSKSRHILKECLRRAHSCLDVDIYLCDVKGQSPTVSCCGQVYSISFAYDEDCVLVALSRNRPIGVDILSKPIDFAWQDVAKTYFRPELYESLLGQEKAFASVNFAQAWVANEARLKCLGMPLQEWSNSLELKLGNASLSYLTESDFPLIAIAEQNGS